MQGVPLSHAKQVPRAFTEGAFRQSILGHAPIGSPIDKKENLLHIAGKSNRPVRKSSTESDTGKGTIGQIHSSFPEHGEPLLKKQRGQRAFELGEESANENKVQQPPKANYAKILDCEDDENASEQLEDDSVDQDRAAEVQGVGTSLKVTIQRSSESRAFSTTSEETDVEREKGKVAVKCTCYICNIACPDQQAFQTHMVSLDHQQRMMEIQRASNTCLASMLPQSHESLHGTDRERKMGCQRWCPTCQCHFCGDIIEHRRTTKHKLAKISSRPFCTLCERHFRTPRKFVEHMKSPEHKQRVEELRDDGGPEVMEELITVDAVGCFEGEDDYEEDRNEEVPVLEKSAAQKEVIPEKATDCEVYDPATQYGTSFVVPVAGFLCKLCHKFYHFESSAHETHCRSFMHFQNLQKYNALKRQKKPHEDSESDVSCSSPMVDPQELEHPSDSIQSDLNTSHICHPKKKRRSKKRHKSRTPNSVSLQSSTVFTKHLVCTSHFGSGSYNQEFKESGVQVQCSKSSEKDKSSYDLNYRPEEHKNVSNTHSLCHVSQLNSKENVSQYVEFKETVSKDQTKQTLHVHKSPVRTVKNT